MMEHAEEHIPMAETTEAGWRNYLAEFDEKVWPMFDRYGYTKDTALVMWQLSKIRDAIEGISVVPDDEGWQET